MKEKLVISQFVKVTIYSQRNQGHHNKTYKIDQLSQAHHRD